MPYSVTFTIPKDGESINIHSLTCGICRIINRQEILRVNVHEVLDDSGRVELVQKVRPVSHFKNNLYTIVDLTAFEKLEKRDIMERELDSFALQHFSFNKQLFAFRLFVLSPAWVLLAINVHHIIFDGASMVLLVHELLNAINDDKPCVTVEHQLSFDGHQSTIATSQQIEEWKKMLCDSGFPLAIRFSDPKIPFAPESCHSYLPLTYAVQHILQRLSKTLCVPQTTLLNTIACVALGVLAGSEDFVVGLVGMNRSGRQQEFIGYYAKTLPLRVNFSSKPSLASLAQSVLKNCGMVFGSPVQLPEIVANVPYLKHGVGEFTPLHVLLSVYHFDKTFPLHVAIDGVSVVIQISHGFQLHFQSDLLVEIHPQGTINDTITLHYQFPDSCFNINLILNIHNAISDYIMDTSRHTEPITAHLFPKLKTLCEWRMRILPHLIPLSLPTNVAHENDNLYISKDIRLHDNLKSDADRIIMMGAFACVMCYYCNQESIGIISIKYDAVRAFSFDKTSDKVDKVFERFVSKIEGCRVHEISVKDFNAVYGSISAMENKCFVVWSEEAVGGLCCPVGLHIDFKVCKTDSIIKISARGNCFNNDSLATLAKSFQDCYHSLCNRSFEKTNIDDIIYWFDLVEMYQPPACNIPLNECYIQQLANKISKEYSYFTAFAYKDTFLTYHCMMNQVSNVGVEILRNIVDLGSNVGVFLTRTPMLYISILGVLKAGCTYVPISPDTPPNRLSMILKLGSIGTLVTESHLLRNLSGYMGDVICVDELPLFDECTTVVPIPDLFLELIACILFTSGTTGTPKGVMVSNRNILYAISNIINLTSSEESTITLASSNVAFDAHIIDSLTPLLRGSCLVVVENILYITPDITHAFATPSAICCVHIPNSMQSLLIGGEAFTTACYNKTKHVKRVTNMYGPTECTVFATYTTTYNPDDPSNIGKLSQGCGYRILAPSGNPVPPYFPGILHIYGPQVTKGYYNDKRNTKLNFVFPKAPSNHPHFCTGDWVRRLSDGSLQFLGRTDSQVKLRGQRFELLEVENAIYNHGSVESVCTFIQSLGMPQAALIACVSPENVPIKSLTNHLELLLPPYMIPKIIIPLQEMPLTDVGKIDRAKLKLMAGSRAMSGIVQSESEETKGMASDIADIFARVLGLPESSHFSITCDFFLFGGHSLLVVTLVNMINQKFNSAINASHVLQYTTPLALANYITCQILHKTKDRTMTKHQTTPVEKTSFKKNSDTALSSSTTKETKVEFFVKFSKDNDSSLLANACFKLISTPVRNIEGGYLRVMSSGLGNVSFASTQKIGYDDSDLMSLSLHLPNVTGPVSPLDQYYNKILPLHYLQFITHPESFIDFKFLDPVSPILLSNHIKEGIKTKNYEQASYGLLEAGICKSPDSIKEYVANCSNPELVLVKHIKVISFLSFQAEDPVVILQKPIASEDPLFFVHGGIIGWSLPYLSLSKKYGKYSVALQRTIHTPKGSLRDVAKYFMEVVLKIQPEGPYSLFGVCYGACLAYEIAHAFVANGHTVKLLTMIDNSPVQECRPALFDHYGSPLPGTALDPVVFFSNLLDVPFPYKELRLSPDQSKLMSVIRVLVSKYPWMDFDEEDLRKLYMPFYNGVRCQWEHTPQATDGIDTCLLIRNKTPHPFFESESYGMSKMVKNIEVVVSNDDLGYLSKHATADFVLKTIGQYFI